MNTNLTARNRFRKRFGHIKEILDMPNLIEVQRESYEQFLQSNIEPNKRIEFGLQQVLKEIFPIHDYAGKATLEFIKYQLEPPKYDVDECKQRGFTFASGLKVTLRLIRYEIDEEDLEETFGDAKRAFQSFTRAGFTEEELEDEGHLEAFRIGAGALIEVGAQLQNFLSSISRVVRHDSLLEEKFKKDQEIFSNQFHTIYGVLQ